MENAILFEHQPIPKRIPINASRFSLGRGLENSHVITDLSVSRRHSVLEFNNNDWYIFDVSANGTWVNESLIDKADPHKLIDGDIIKLSELCQYTFRIMPPPPQTRRTNLTDEEIMTAAEEVMAIVEDFNSDFSESEITKTESQTIECGEQQGVNRPSVSTETTVSESQKPPAVSEPSNSTVSNQISSSALQEDQASGGACSLPRYNIEFAEEELQCSICTEMFVKAVTLRCSHTFCSYCISQWQNTKKDCPICRAVITAKCPTKILDNYIEKISETASDEFRNHRKQLIAKREAAEAPQPLPGPSRAVVYPVRATASSREDWIEISSEEGDDDDEDMSTYSDDDSDRDYYLDDDGVPQQTPYYGGYGRCYSCGCKGHWSNNCPYKRR